MLSSVFFVTSALPRLEPLVSSVRTISQFRCKGWTEVRPVVRQDDYPSVVVITHPGWNEVLAMTGGVHKTRAKQELPTPWTNPLVLQNSH